MSAEEEEVDRVFKALLARDPTACGELLFRTCATRTPVLIGTLHSALTEDKVRDAINVALPEYMGSVRMQATVLPSRRSLHIVGLSSAEDREEVADARVTPEAERNLDEVKVLFHGRLPISMIRPHGGYKRQQGKVRDNLSLIYGVLHFMPPIIVDRTLKVIDGDLRLSVAREYMRDAHAAGRRADEDIAVVVVDDAGARTDFLRLALNRLAEFQRWDYGEVDAYADAVPQAQPLLEPIGIFGERLLPVSFFGDSIENYALDVFNNQQSQYKQELGLAEWARIQRERRDAAKAAKGHRRLPKTLSQSLFALEPREEDFLPTHDVREVMDSFIAQVTEHASTANDHYQGRRREEREERGQEWQSTRRTSRETTDARRAEAMGEEA